MLKILVGDDNPFMRSALTNILSEILGVEVVGEAEDGEESIKKVVEKSPDIVLLDIDMPKMNGIEAARKIVQINPRVFIIFVTAYNNYTHEAFEVYAVDYIVKPFEKERILKTIERIKDIKDLGQKNYLEQLQSQNKGYKVPIKNNNEVHLIDVSEIILISRTWRKTTIYTKTQILENYDPLQKIEEQLPGDKFLRCHRSYIINKDMVREFSPYGKKTYQVKLTNIKETALITLDKYKEFIKSL